ncbi:YdcH family protein [Asticcacaulis machinosus]|uniref:YdcH family protein n=1 Tax=Asticcacaulis machinosus TaxID=2984211 RepID=UPI0034A30C98
MHDDQSNIRSLFPTQGLTLVKSGAGEVSADIERRVFGRRDVDAENFDDIAEDVLDYQKDDLDPTVRELPISVETVQLRGQAAHLRMEHKDLDESISALESMPLPDQILIARLKRKKLALRDQITEIEDKIRPDIIA